MQTNLAVQTRNFLKITNFLSVRGLIAINTITNTFMFYSSVDCEDEYVALRQEFLDI